MVESVSSSAPPSDIQKPDAQTSSGDKANENAFCEALRGFKEKTGKAGEISEEVAKGIAKPDEDLFKTIGHGIQGVFDPKSRQKDWDKARDDGQSYEKDMENIGKAVISPFTDTYKDVKRIGEDKGNLETMKDDPELKHDLKETVIDDSVALIPFVGSSGKAIGKEVSLSLKSSKGLDGEGASLGHLMSEIKEGTKGSVFLNSGTRDADVTAAIGAGDIPNVFEG